MSSRPSSREFEGDRRGPALSAGDAGRAAHERVDDQSWAPRLDDRRVRISVPGDAPRLGRSLAGDPRASSRSVALRRPLSADPDACLVNLYRGRARMGLHQDRDEQDFSAPVVSVSLGDTAIFRLGGVRRTDPTSSVRFGLRRCLRPSGRSAARLPRRGSGAGRLLDTDPRRRAREPDAASRPVNAGAFSGGNLNGRSTRDSSHLQTRDPSACHDRRGSIFNILCLGVSVVESSPLREIARVETFGWLCAG